MGHEHPLRGNGRFCCMQHFKMQGTIFHARRLHSSVHRSHDNLKGLRPLPPTPADSWIFGFVDFSKNDDFSTFPMEFGVWEGLQSIGNGCGLQIHRLSVHFEAYGSIFDVFHHFTEFAVASDGLTVFPEHPRTLVFG